MKQAKVLNIERQHYGYVGTKLARSEQEYQELVKKGYRSVNDSSIFPMSMARRSRIAVTIKNDNNEKVELDIRPEILRFYGKKKCSRRQYYKFLSDLEKGRVKIYVEGDKLYLRAN